MCLKLECRGRRGFPDRSIFLPNGRVVFVELKQPGGRRSYHQIEFARRLSIVEQRVYTLDNMQDFIEVIDANLLTS